EYGTERGSKLVMYPPQVENWASFRTVVARVAVAFSRNPKEAPMVGSFRVSAETSVEQAARTVLLTQIRITDARFPALDSTQTRELVTEIRRVLPGDGFAVSLDRMLANLRRNQAGLKDTPVSNEPPAIFVSQKLAILVLLDGAPIWSPIKAT